jgi:hypothetical protein
VEGRKPGITTENKEKTKSLVLKNQAMALCFMLLTKAFLCASVVQILFVSASKRRHKKSHALRGFFG